MYPNPFLQSDNRSMEQHYIKSLGHDDIKFYPSNQTIDLWNTTTPNLWVMMTLSFMPLLQSTRDLWNTTTLNKFHIQKNVHIPRADVPPCSNQP